jgi:hypothetical protein
VSNSFAPDGCLSRLFQSVACKTFLLFQAACLIFGDCFSNTLGQLWSGSAEMIPQQMEALTIQLLILTEIINFILSPKHFV